MKRWFPVIILLLVLTAMFGAPSLVQAVTIPTISIVSVEPDVSVTIKTADYPANVDFDVRMGKIGTKAIDGFLVDTVNSGPGGAQTYTFDIPADLQGLDLIAIRLESVSGFFSYNWFANKAAGAVTTPAAPAVTPVPAGTPVPGIVIPTFTITAVVKNVSVSIHTANFPAKTDFDVRMGKIGTKGINGFVVDTINSGNGGTLDATFDIPSDLAGLDQISIRLESKSGYFSYNWFWNNTAP